MGIEGLVAVAKRIDKLADATVGDKATIKLTNSVGLMAKASVMDVGKPYNLDSSGSPMEFSRWPNTALQAKYSLSRKPGAVVVHRAPRSAGPWRVAEEGVKAQTKGDKLAAGFRKNKNGTVVQKYKKSKRSTKGGTGSFTWSEYERIVLSKAPHVMLKELRHAFIRGIS